MQGLIKMINNILTAEEARHINGETINPDRKLYRIMNDIMREASKENGKSKTSIMVKDLDDKNRDILLQLGYDLKDKGNSTYEVSWDNVGELTLEETEDLTIFTIKALFASVIIVVIAIFIAWIYISKIF